MIEGGKYLGAMALFQRGHLGMLRAMVFFFVTLMAPMGCNGPDTRELVLNDFEADSDLDQIHWQCRTLFSLSYDHVVSGKQSLKIELFPAAYPGLALKLEKRDWSRHAAVALDIYNPQDETLEITVRIDDRSGYPDYEDRYNGRHTLLPGGNHLSIPLHNLRTSGAGEPLNLKTIKRFLFFMVDTREIYSLYVDNIRLKN